jgi:hypothetical protein
VIDKGREARSLLLGFHKLARERRNFIGFGIEREMSRIEDINQERRTKQT